MVVISSGNEFSQKQIEYLSSLHFINMIGEHIKSVSSIRVSTDEDYKPVRIILELEIYYDNNKMDDLEFNLYNYDYEDIIDVARNIRTNEFILQEIDNVLAGDIE